MCCRVQHHNIHIYETRGLPVLLTYVETYPRLQHNIVWLPIELIFIENLNVRVGFSENIAQKLRPCVKMA
jgi:hypothetical protein